MVFKLNPEDTLIKVVFSKMYAINICNIVDIKKQYINIDKMYYIIIANNGMT